MEYLYFVPFSVLLYVLHKVRHALYPLEWLSSLI